MRSHLSLLLPLRNGVTFGEKKGQLSNLCFRSHLLHKGKGRGNACAAVMRTFFRVTSSPSPSVEETLVCAHFVDCSGYINRYIDKCPSTVAKEFSFTVHPKCSLSKAAHLGYIIYISLCSLVGSSETSSSNCSTEQKVCWLFIHLLSLEHLVSFLLLTQE